MGWPGRRRGRTIGHVKDESADRSPGAVSLRLTVGPGDPIAGVLLVEERAVTVAFTGWVELMSAIAGARSGELTNHPDWGGSRNRGESILPAVQDPTSGDGGSCREST